ncbi:hypothetical protein GGH93_005457 [Coemansia aciculifera]|nr:hypothetical protein GGH93_005457 [Coemansia aciculifera]
MAESVLASEHLTIKAHKDTLEAQKEFNTAYQQAALAWWQCRQRLLSAGSANAMMCSISCSIWAKQNSASPSSIQHEDK